MNIFFRLYKKKYFQKLSPKLRPKPIQKPIQKPNKKPKPKPNQKPKPKPTPPKPTLPNPIPILTPLLINPSSNSTHIALLIGINYFSNQYTQQQLYGCINDIRRVKQLLIQRGFLEQNIMYMTDDKSTLPTSSFYPNKKNIVANFNSLLEGIVINSLGEIKITIPNPICFFYYSGHGGNILMNEPIKLNTQYGQFDFIVPCDYNQNNMDSIITDVEIKNIINKNSNFMMNMFFDSCVNQTICNLAYGYYSTMNNTQKFPFQVTTNNITCYTNENILTNSQVFQMSGSKENQDSIDVNNLLNPDGAFTMAFLNYFSNPLISSNWYDLLFFTRSWLKVNKYSQIPQLSSGQLADIKKTTISF